MPALPIKTSPGAHRRLTRGAAVLLAGAVLGVAGCSADSATPDPNGSPTGEPAVCDAASVGQVIQVDVNETYPGATFVALDSFECADGWVYARAQVESGGVTVPTSFFLRSVQSTWVPVSINEICAQSPEVSGVPDLIYTAACGLPE
mgnify:CR=1 FL=1